MRKILFTRRLVKCLTVFFCWLIASYSFSQVVKDEIQVLYDQAEVIAFVSPDYGKSKYPILDYTAIYGFDKIFLPEELLLSVNGIPLIHTIDISTKTAYFEDIYLKERYGPFLLNLHYNRGNTSYQPQWLYKQTFAIYKILLPMAAHLIIDGGDQYKVERHLGLKHNPYYSGSQKDMIHIFSSTRFDEDRIWQLYPTTDTMEEDLPMGEYYLLVSSTPSGIRSTYNRGNITTRIRILTQRGNTITYNYDKTGNRINRMINIASHTLKVDEQPEQIVKEMVDKRDIKIYSSIKGQITVEFSTLEGIKNGTMQIYSFPMGTPVINQKIQNLREDLDINTQPSGVYILLIDIDGERTTHKLMK